MRSNKLDQGSVPSQPNALGEREAEDDPVSSRRLVGHNKDVEVSMDSNKGARVLPDCQCSLQREERKTSVAGYRTEIVQSPEPLPPCLRFSLIARA